MTARRVFKLSAAGVLSLGLLALFTPAALEAAGKQEDAKKYTEQLKTAKDAKKKVEALEELGKLGQVMKSLVEPAVPDIKESLKDKSAEVRAAAAYTYGKISPEPKEAVPALLKMMKEDSSEAVKMGAIQGLGALGADAKDALKDLRTLATEERKKDKTKQTKLGQKAQDSIRVIQHRSNKN